MRRLLLSTTLLLFVSLLAPPPLRALGDEELLDDTQWRACLYFWEQSLPGGLVRDTLGSEAASIAATGFGASAMTILAERFGSTPRWTVSPAAARGRVEAMMETVLAVQARQDGHEETWGRAGIPFHFVRADGRRDGRSEVSTADGALLLAGFLQAGEHFGGAVREKAERIFSSVDFKAFWSSRTGRYSHGWTPEGGLIAQEWDRPTDEILLLSILSLARDPGDRDRRRALYSWPREVESYRGIAVVRSYFGSLFTYTFAHFWLPFDCLGRDRPAAAGFPLLRAVDWGENSRHAVAASRLYSLDRLPRYPALGPDDWGASACYRADGSGYFGPNGTEPSEAPAAYDGTIPPHGAIMSLSLAAERTVPLSDNPAFAALRHYHQTRFATLWSRYGPRSSFDARGNTSRAVVGIEKGPEALGIEAWRTGLPARELAGHPAVRAALELVFERTACPPAEAAFVRGRINDDPVVDISDPVHLLAWLFTGGPPPACEDAADANDDGSLDLSDAVALLSYLFLGAPPPPAPFPEPGLDPSEDALASCGTGRDVG